MEVKIQIPDNCELIKDGDTYIVKEKKKQGPPKSWEEFCKRYPLKNDECFITSRSNISTKEDYRCDSNRHCIEGRNWCISIEEARAFLALMQLRQLRKAWVGDWEQSKKDSCAGIFYNIPYDEVTVSYDKFWTNITLSFPTNEMARDFHSCFKDLCEIAKPLL